MRGKTAEDNKLLALLDPVAEALGYEIVRLRMMGGAVRRTLQIMAEDAHGEMLVEDCTEVSSPGVDRPLTRLKDFAEFEGFEAKIELDRIAEGRKRFRGQLAGVEDDNVAIDLEGEEHTALLPFAWIVDAKLILTDPLMKRGADQRAARLASQDAQDIDPPTDPQEEDA